MVDSDDYREFGADIVKGTSKAVIDSFNSTNINGTAHTIAGITLIIVGARMLKNNAVPLATMGVCLGAACFTAAPAYRSVKAVIKAPFKGFTDD
jgi:hypothetical protein